MANQKFAIQTTNLGIDFKSVRALSDMSMNIEAGTIFGFLGPNGAGKTTTIRLLLGLIKPTRGNAMILGFDPITDGDQIRQNCGVLLEHSGLYETLSAEDNLEFFGKIWNLSYNERKTRIKELLMHIDLWDRRKEKVGKWSKGMKQKLAVVRCLLHRPELIFLDEPTSGLDPVATAALRIDLLNIVKKEGSSIFLTTHNLDEAQKMCDNIGIINRGKLLAIGSSDSLTHNNAKTCKYEIKAKGITDQTLEKLKVQISNELTYDGSSIYIELPVTESISPVIAAIIAEGIEINGANKVEVNLEQTYLKIMEGINDK